jgi:hypothetical protein
VHDQGFIVAERHGGGDDDDDAQAVDESVLGVRVAVHGKGLPHVSTFIADWVAGTFAGL